MLADLQMWLSMALAVGIILAVLYNAWKNK